jgi:hypothetical protein
MNLSKAIRGVLATYPPRSLQLAKAIEDVVQTYAERLAKESEKDLAFRKCLKKLHNEVGCDEVVCRACAERGGHRVERVVGDPLA